MMVAAQPLEMSARAGGVSFEACYRAHRKDVYRWALRYACGNHGWAEDLTHDVFLKLLEHLPRLTGAEELGGWLYRVTANLAVNRIGRDNSFSNRILRLLGGQPEPVHPGPDRAFERRESAAAALRLVALLPANERVVLCMKLLDGKSQREISQALGLSEGYVSKLVARGLERARRAGWEVRDAAA